MMSPARLAAKSLLIVLAVAPWAWSDEGPQSISVAPSEILLIGNQARQQLLVSGEYADRLAGDLTRVAAFQSADPTIAEVTPQGLVVPKKSGTTMIEVKAAGHTASTKVTVYRAEEQIPADFRTDVIAAISRAGCSQGACHGSPQGKDGFMLSLRGFDPSFDLQSLTRETGSRRTNVLQPQSSLILLKGTGRVPHQGGVRFQPGDTAYETLLSWITAGCSDSKPPRQLVELETVPSRRTLHPGSPQQQIIALARFDDGTTIDVTRLAVFSTRLDPAAGVSADGLVKFISTGEATILVRYLQQVRSVRLTYVDRDPQYAFKGPAVANEIDRQVFAKQQALQLQPSSVAGDAVFLRRVYLDTIGELPSADEAREFLDSTAPDKRAKLIDSLLERDEYASFWALKWADVMRGNRNTVSQRGVHSMHRWLVKSFAEDRPLSDLAREILTGQGNTLHHPAANFFRIAPTPDEAAESFAQLFLGVRMQCAKCHNHPFESLTQSDYYGLAAYFARVKIKGKQFGLDDEVVYLDRQGEVQHPLTRRNLEPAMFGVSAGLIAPEEDRRSRLADWLTSPSNRMLARSTVNRIWFHLLGRGIVDPVDDFRDTNPPSHPELLDALAQQFIDGGYRFKPVIRTILNSHTYQMSAEAVPQSAKAADAARYFTRASVRMLTAEQAIDAVSSAIGLPETFAGYPRGTKAIELAEGAVENHFLMAFSRPLRDAACDCAREDDPSLNEALHLLNNSELIHKIESPESRLGKLLSAGKPTGEILEQLYLAALSRRPTPAEIKLCDDHNATVGDRNAALQDLQHTLLNSNEFLLRH
jgi:hypothetical protein